MGGYGTLRIAMKYPGVFSSIYMTSACCLKASLNPSDNWGVVWDQADALAKAEALRSLADVATADGGTMRTLARAAAWSPNPKNPPFFFDLPSKGGQLQPEVIARWAANAPLAMIDQYVPNLKKLRAIGFIVNARVQRTVGGALPFDMPGAQRGTDAICAFTHKTNALECIGQTFQGRMHPTRIGLADGAYAVFLGFNAAPTAPGTVADSGELLGPPFFESRQAPYRTDRLTDASRPVKAIRSSGHGG